MNPMRPEPRTESEETTGQTSLIGASTGRPGSDETRVPINIDAYARDELRHLLYQPFMIGVGWSEFIERAVRRAYDEAEEQGLWPR